MALLRDRAGDYTRDLLSENAGTTDAPLLLSEQADARCSRDLCLAKAGRLTVLATRSVYMVDVGELIAACRRADIVVSERRLPRGCRPRWLRLDRPVLAKTGGVAVSRAGVRTVLSAGDRHPWRDPPTVTPIRPARPSRPAVAADGASGTAAAAPPGSGP